MPQASETELIKSIVPYYHDNTFNDRFEHMTRDLSKSRRFLVKMEVNRLHTECHRNIDLRGRVEGSCVEYQHDGLTHHLDPVAIDVFEEAISVYTKYTTGVFEEVTNTQNSYREKQQQQDKQRRDALQQSAMPATKTANTAASEEVIIPPHHIPVLHLTDFKLRAEERVNILAKITIRLSNGHNIDGITSNLSVHGAKVKLTGAVRITDGDTLYIKFLHLTDPETNDPIDLDIIYQVINIEHHNNQSWFGLKRQHQDANIDQLLAGFIKQQRKNIATDVEHVVDAIRSLGYQQIYLNRLSGLPIFFGVEQEQYNALFTLCNNHNREILSYWKNQQNLIKINGLLTNSRLKHLTNKETPNNATAYCFTHISKGKKFFYSATDFELEQSGLSDLFFHFGANKDSWKVYQLYATSIDEHQWQLPEVLPQHLIAKEQLTLDQHKHMLKLHNISLMTYLVDITDAHNQACYAERLPSDHKLNQLQRYGHKDAVTVGLDIIETNNHAQRSEDRFTYQTKIVIAHKKKQYHGATIDFSVHGMQISMKHSIALNKGDIVHLEMPLLEKVSGKKELSSLEYELMRITPDGRTLNLRITKNPAFEHGPKLIYRIIKKNQHKLTAQVAPPTNLTKSINLFYCHHIDCLPLVISKLGNNYKISHAIEPAPNNKLFNLFNVLSNTPDYCNVSVISAHNTFKEVFGNTLMQLTAAAPAAHKEIYIHLHDDPTTNSYRAELTLFEQFDSHEQHHEFIKKARRQGQLFAIRIMISRSYEMNYKQLSRELIYAAKQASFKTRQLQAELDAVVAVAELVDISGEIEQRFNIN